MKQADKDILETLADLEFQAEMETDCEDFNPAPSQRVTTFRRVVREAGYEIPADFDWQQNLPEDPV